MGPLHLHPSSLLLDLSSSPLPLLISLGSLGKGPRRHGQASPACHPTKSTTTEKSWRPGTAAAVPPRGAEGRHHESLIRRHRWSCRGGRRTLREAESREACLDPACGDLRADPGGRIHHPGIGELRKDVCLAVVITRWDKTEIWPLGRKKNKNKRKAAAVAAA